MSARVALAALALCSMSAPALAQATHEVFKCRDERGHWTYTNDRRLAEKNKCELVSSQKINVAPAQKSARPATFPRESSTDRASATGRQREILERELAQEQQSLTRARQALAEQEAVRSGDERNFARVQERLQPYQETVQNHQKNIEALQRELANLNR
jgi:Ulp1 family protease